MSKYIALIMNRLMGSLLISIFTICLSLLSVEPIKAYEKRIGVITDSLEIKDDVMVKMNSFNNAYGVCLVSVKIYPGNSPLKINNILWQRLDTILTPIEPVEVTLNNVGTEGERLYWIISVEYPYTEYFFPTESIIVNTDRGNYRVRLHKSGEMLDTIDELKNDKDDLSVQLSEINQKYDNYKNLWIIFLIIAIILFLFSVTIIFCSRFFIKKILKKFKEVKSQLESLEHNMNQLEEENLSLYRKRLDSINSLCEGYYEKSGIENMKTAISNDLRNYIMSFKDKKKIEELRTEIDSLQNNIITRIKEQIPNLTNEDLNLITYLIGGFSPRAVSVFLDINLKQFYYRRSKLQQHILASEAPEREFFASKI